MDPCLRSQFFLRKALPEALCPDSLPKLFKNIFSHT